MTLVHFRVRKTELTPYARLLREVAEAEGTTLKLARAVLDRFIAELPKAVWATGRLVVPGLGSFRVRARKQRRISDPSDPERARVMTLPATRLVACRVAESWRRR
jgi:nucleoid DNA-binding protein